MGTQPPVNVSTRLERIAKLAKGAPEMSIRLLAHIDIDLLREAYRLTRKDGAIGIDGQSAAEYAKELEGNLKSLLDRAKSGTYRAPPVRRVHIPKGDGKETRPAGHPDLRGQGPAARRRDGAWSRVRAVLPRMLVRISARALSARNVGGALESDDGYGRGMGPRGRHSKVLRCDRARPTARGHSPKVIDGVLLRLIGKWLNAGVLEDGDSCE